MVATSSCSPVGSHLQRKETKEYVDVISAEAYLLQSTEEEKSGISKSNQILKKASQSKEAQILRLCRDASYAECLEMGQLLRSKPVSSALEWIQRVAELDSANGFFRRTRPNTVIGPVMEPSIFHVWWKTMALTCKYRTLKTPRRIAGSFEIVTIPKTRGHQLQTISAEGDLQLRRSQVISSDKK